MAEYIMKDLVRKAGLESQFQIASAATSGRSLEIQSILLPSASWQNMGSAVPATPHGSS